MKFYKRAGGVALIVALAAAGCQSAPSSTLRSGAVGPDMAQARAERYDGPKARIAVARFVDKSAKGAADQIGEGMADMLTTALFQTNRYIVLDRSDLDAVVNEQDFAEKGRVSPETAAAIGQIEGADLLVFAAITEFEPDHIGAGGVVMGIISLGVSIAVASKNKDAPIGAATYKESMVGLDFKIVDSATGRVVYTGSVEGRNKTLGGLLVGAVGGGWSRSPFYLGGFAGTGVEQAVRRAIDAVVIDMAAKTPAEYYRVSDTLSGVTASQLEPFYPVALQGEPSLTVINRRQAMVVNNQRELDELMGVVRLPAGAAPAIDWEKSRLLAVFGARPSAGYATAAVTKIIHHANRLEVFLSQTNRELSDEEREAMTEEGIKAPIPFDLVRIAAPGKPVVFVWR